MPPTTSYELTLRHLLSNVEQNDAGCWIWKQSCGSHGYGQTWNGRTVLLAHRAIYEMTWGPIPDGHEVDHKCFERRCVNPLHLEAVTPQENSQRAWDGGRRERVTHCVNGHEYTSENTATRTITGANGKPLVSRECRTCQRERAQRYNHRKRGQPTYTAPQWKNRVPV